MRLTWKHRSIMNSGLVAVGRKFKQGKTTERLVKSCVPVSVERVDKDKDGDEKRRRRSNKNGRPVSEQLTGSFTQLEEIDIDFRVSGLPHAVVKEAEHFRVQELVKKIESHPHREALQADLQQKKRPQPIQQQFEGDDPRIGQCRVIRVVRNNTKSTMFPPSSFIGIKELCAALADNSWLTKNPEESSTNYDWLHSLSRTT